MAIELNEKIIEKLDFIDRCRENFSLKDSEKLKLPQIIVVGDQSSGKSSIIEALSGIKLPKGNDTVTKRPIVVHMRRSQKEMITIHCGDKKYNDINDVEAKIREIQGSVVTSEPINVNIESPTVQHLTVIDLPGIVRQALIGQPKNIVEDTENVSKYYMKQENSLIICVIPSNVDFNTVGTINLASQCDPKYIRTIGVLTKIDKLADDEISSKIRILKNVTKPLEKGYFGLILPDSILSLPVDDRERKENEEFRKKAELWNECSNMLGMKNFKIKLVNELVLLMEKTLPSLQSTMEELLSETNKELEKYDDIYESQQSQRKYLIEIKDDVLRKVDHALVKGHCKLREYQLCIEFLRKKGFIKKDPKDKHDTFLYSQHQIFGDLLNKMTRNYKENFKIPTHKYNVKYLQDLADRCSTEHIPIFLSSEPFKEVVWEHLEQYKQDSLNCLGSCKQLAEHFVEGLIPKCVYNKFAGLDEAFKASCVKQLETQYKMAESHLNLIFKSELRCFTQKQPTVIKDDKDASVDTRQTNAAEFANSQNPIQMNKKMITSQSMNMPPAMKDKEGDNTSLSGKDDPKTSSGRKLKETLEDYIQNMITRLADVVPNLIMLTLFEEFHCQLQNTLNQVITGEDILKHFQLSDTDKVIRNELHDTRNNLEKSLDEYKNLL